MTAEATHQRSGLHRFSAVRTDLRLRHFGRDSGQNEFACLLELGTPAPAPPVPPYAVLVTVRLEQPGLSLTASAETELNVSKGAPKAERNFMELNCKNLSPRTTNWRNALLKPRVMRTPVSVRTRSPV